MNKKARFRLPIGIRAWDMPSDIYTLRYIPIYPAISVTILSGSPPVILGRARSTLRRLSHRARDWKSSVRPTRIAETATYNYRDETMALRQFRTGFGSTMSSSALADRRCTQPQPGRRKVFTLAVAWWPAGNTC